MERPITIYAGFWRRFVAMLIDWAILWMPGSVFGWFVDKSQWDPGTFVGLDVLQMLVIWTIYFGSLESSKYQGTVGKILMGLKVTDMAGGRISFIRASCRYLAQMASASLAGIGYLMIIWTERKQGLHDLICDCLVVKILNNTVAE
ncbi:MAG: RDD family protein [Alcaligenaceae bacterium]